MSKTPPPVPPANRSTKGPGEDRKPPPETARSTGAADSAKTGQQANTRINTTHQGLQQDR